MLGASAFYHSQQYTPSVESNQKLALILRIKFVLTEIEHNPQRLEKTDLVTQISTHRSSVLITLLV